MSQSPPPPANLLAQTSASVKTIPASQPIGQQKPRSGFALIAVLLLVALVTLLVAITSIVTQVERRAVSNSVKTEKARENALFALNVALEQLQREAGPDQRITARADILDSKPDTPEVDDVKQPYWTGVWKTGKAELDVATSGDPQRKTSLGSVTPTLAGKSSVAKWLVSNPNPATPLDPIGGPSAATVPLAKNYGPDSKTGIVSAPVVDIKDATARTTGRYAYWTSDEGVKAKVNLSNDNVGLDPEKNLVESQLQFTSPSSSALHKIFQAPNPLSEDFRSNTAVSKIMTIDSMKFLPAKTADFSASNYASDVTTHSFGVLADVRFGGLKKDLTAAFEDDANGNANATGAFAKLLSFSDIHTGYTGTNKGKVYAITPIGGSYFSTYSRGYSADGLRWISLYNHYSLYKPSAAYPKGFPGGTITPPLGVGSPAALPIVEARNYNSDTAAEGAGSANGNLLLSSPLTARVLAWQIHMGLMSYQDPVDLRWKLKILLMPALVLYNPYNVKLKHPPGFQYQFSGWYLQNGGFDDIRFTVGANTPPNQFNLQPLQNFSLGAQGAQGDVGPIYRTDATADINLDPGEIRIYGLRSKVDPPVGANNFRSLANFFSPDFYHAINLGKLPVSVFAQSNPPGQNYPSPNDQPEPRTNLPYFNNPPNPGATAFNLFTQPPSPFNEKPTKDQRTSANTYFIGTANGDDRVLIRRVYPRIRSNDGRLTAELTAPNFWRSWPQGGNITSQYAGHMFLPDITLPALQTPLDLGYIRLLTEPVKFMTYTVWMKGTDSYTTIGDTTGKGSITPQPMPTFSSAGTYLNPTGYEIGAAVIDLQSAVGVVSMDKQSLNSTPDATNKYVRSYWGDSVTGGQTQIILKDVPRQPLVSLGQFMHMGAAYDPNRSGSVLRSPELLPVGGSWASAFVPREKKFVDDATKINMTTGSGEGGGAIQNEDDNFMANESLFDTYFFSTVPSPYQVANKDKYAPRDKTFNQEYISANTALPNSRHRYYRSSKGEDPTVADLRDFDKAAANLLLDGSFNVNSTSVNAWIALLSSLSSNKLLATDGKVVDTGTGSPIPRVLCPLTGGTASVNTPWGGVRSLSDDEVKNLAQEIVKQVKLRGPFLSMGDFLNRRLVPAAADATNKFGLYGALQAAIENSTVNQAVKSSVGRPVDYSKADLKNPDPTKTKYPTFEEKNLPTNTATGIPGYLMQQDIVQAFAPVLTARSDTFVVRCYGEVLSKTGAVEGRAWGEAVVQRTPDFVDQSDSKLTLGTLGNASDITTLNTTNQTFGRRFKIVSFRWLNENEI